ncbi:hypothetical protein I4U23_030406 [Adineta vaga]|nr:hypothetical protein I4U23_030406 [Adineta vaga]
MNYFIKIFLYFLFLSEINGNIILINDPTHVHYPPYTIHSINIRIKRDKLTLLSSENNQCDQHIYTKLYSCSQLTDCTALTTCLQSIHCSINNKSYGSLILNLLNLLGLNNCQHNDLHTSCPNTKRVIILHNLLTHWTGYKVGNHNEYQVENNEDINHYCQTISNFISEVKNEIKEQCSLYSRQVDAFLENYFCSTNPVSFTAKSGTSELEHSLHWSKLDDTLRKLSINPSKTVDFDEDNDFYFFNSNQNLFNTTEQTVYVNDHHYYNVSYIIPKSQGLPLYFVQDTNQFTHIQALADQHRTAFSINLKFDFPFYGHNINKIMVGTGGFIYTGDLLHSALIGSTQYIAPFMANFDVNIGGNRSEIKYIDNSTHFICTWNNLYLQDQPDIGSFTFQAILQNTGNIYFNYIRIPSMNISNVNHAHRIGLSDAYMSEHTTNEHIVRVITLYDKLNLEHEKIQNGVSVMFAMDKTCNTFTDCTSCLANRGKRYNCSWCDTIQKCSDGYDRSRHQWIQGQCHYLALENICPNNIEEPFIDTDQMLRTPFSSVTHSDEIKTYQQHSTLSTIRTIFVTLLLTVLILSLIAFIGTYIYAYWHPTSPPESIDINGDSSSPTDHSPNLNSVDKNIKNAHEKSYSNEQQSDHSALHDVRDDDELSNDEQEKQLEEELDDIDIIQKIQTNMSTPAGTAEMMQHTSAIPQKGFHFLSKFPFFRKSNKPKKPQARRLKLFEIYRYADKMDIILMIVGSIAAIITGALFPFMLLLYRRVTNSLVELGKSQANTTIASVIVGSSGGCFILPDNSTDSESPQDQINGVIKYYVLLGFLSVFFYWVAWSSWIIAAERQVRRIRFDLFRNILRQEIGWFDIHNAGELSNRLIDDLDKIKSGISDQVPDFISLVSRMLGALIYALVVGWKLTLVFLSISPLIIITFNITIKVIVKYTIKEIQAFASASSIAQEVLQNIRTVTAFHGQKKEEERFAQNLLRAQKMGLKKGLLMGLSKGFSQIATFAAFTITFWYGPELVRTDCTNYSAGTVIVVFIGCMIATFSTAQFIPNFQSFAEALGSGSYVFDVIDRQTKIDASDEEGDKPQSIIGDIEFKDVIFTYPARPEAPILNKLSLKIPSGKTVALVGASGCGKSTTIQLIQRFYDPEHGQVLLDGKDIKSLNVAWLRSHIGIVSQEPVLFTGSIEENIRFGKPNATDDEVQHAAQMANAHEFIMQLPDNYKTSSGDKLSGGQKQRVAIARALISNPTILLLDEATSALDNTSERVVQDALDKAKKGRTTIVIAHRLSTIRNADLIVGLERGQVVEYGNHDDLMEKRGLYYELVTTQTQKEKEKEADPDSDKEEDEVEKEFVRQRSTKRTISKQSSVSANDFDEEDDDDDITASADPSKKKRKFLRTPFVFRIFKYNAPEWYWILLGSVSSLIFGAMQPLFALFFAQVYGLFAEPDLDEQKRLTSLYAGIIFLIGLAGGLAQFFESYAFAKSGEALTKRMRILTFSAMLRQEMGYFDMEANSVGALVTRLSSDASALKGLTGVRIGIIMQALSAVITALTIAFTSGWKLALIVLCFVPAMMLSGMLQGKKLGKADEAKDKGSFTEQAGQHATQAIEQIRTVVALHREQYFIDLYEDSFNKEFKKQMCRLHLTALGAGIANSLMYFLHSANFSFGAKLVTNKEMEFDKVFRVFAVITFAMITIGRSMAMIPDYAKGKKAALRILRLDKRQSQINPHDESGIILKDVIGDIEFNNIRFRYPSRPTLRILRDFCLECPANSTTALVGPSGSGKSTTIGLLQRFYDPLKGKVLLDGHDIKVLNLRWLRSIMGLVQQEPVLFNLSIRENIAYGDNSREVTQEEIEKAARMANIHELIIALPSGYDTSCGAKGSQLSGGQKQRIAIARALVRSPKLLLLDEATSALDNKSEKVVQAALDNARSGRTCLTIAHRLSTIQNSEKIAVVDRGRMKEEGSHDELLQLNGIYAKLILSQERSN